MRPNPFECRITPRSPEITAAIEREGRQALQDLSQYDGTTQYRMITYYATEKIQGEDIAKLIKQRLTEITEELASGYLGDQYMYT